MQINQYTNTATSISIDDWMDLDKQVSPGVWQSQKIGLSTIVDSMVVLFPELSENIYNSDGALPTGATRAFDLDTGKLNLTNGGLNVGGTGIVGGAFRMEITGSPSGIIVFSTGTAGQFSGNVAAMQLFSSAVGLFSAAPRNVIRDDATVIPAADDSCVLELKSTERGLLIPRMTESERNAIVSPTDYLEIVNTTRERKEIHRPFWGWHPVGTITPDWGYELVDENTSANTVFTYGGTGTQSTLLNTSLSPSVLMGLTTGTASNGSYRHSTANYFLGTTGKKYFKDLVCVNNLSDGTDSYVIQIGYSSSNSGFGNADGMYFIYDSQGAFPTSSASANWLCVCRNGGSYSFVDSGILVTTTSSAMQTLEIFDDGTGANCIFKINGATVATITTQIPDNTKQLYIIERIQKTAGTNARTLYTDFTYAKEKFNTPR